MTAPVLTRSTNSDIAISGNVLQSLVADLIGESAANVSITIPGSSTRAYHFHSSVDFLNNADWEDGTCSVFVKIITGFANVQWATNLVREDASGGNVEQQTLSSEQTTNSGTLQYDFTSITWSAGSKTERLRIRVQGRTTNTTARTVTIEVGTTSSTRVTPFPPSWIVEATSSSNGLTGAGTSSTASLVFSATASTGSGAAGTSSTGTVFHGQAAISLTGAGSSSAGSEVFSATSTSGPGFARSPGTTGSLIFSGTSANSLAPAASDSTGTVFHGQAACTLGAAACAATAELVFSATAACALSGAACSATGDTLAGQGDCTLGAAGCAATGEEVFEATAAPTLAAATCAATAEQVFTGTASCTLGAAGCSATGSTFGATGDCTLAPAACAAAGSEVFEATSSSGSGGAGCSAAGETGQSGTAACVLGAAGCSASGELFHGTGSCVLSPAGCSSSGSEVFSGAATCPLSAAGCSSSATVPVIYSATAALSLAPVSCSAIGLVPVAGADNVTPLELPDVLPLLTLHNWLSPVTVETAYQTDVSEAETVAEDRRLLAARPTRLLRGRLSGVNAADALRLLMTASRLAQGRTVGYLYSDKARITAASSGTTVWCDTRWRRFFVGQRVAVVAFEQNRATVVDHRAILGVLPDRIVVDVALSQTFPKGSRAYPCIDADVALSVDESLHSDRVLDVLVSYQEVAGPSALPPTANDPPGSMQLDDEDGLPILSGRFDWGATRSAGVRRSGEVFGSGKAQVTYVRGERAQGQNEFVFKCSSRESFWPVLNFWDSRRGRGKPFWAVDQSTAFEVDSITTTYADVLPSGNIEDVEDFVQNVGVELRDGTVYRRAVDTVAVAGDFWRITFADALPALGSPLRRLTVARLMRGDSDAMTEEWESDEAVTVRIPARELLEEKSVELAQLDYTPLYNQVLNLPSLLLWVDATVGMRTGTSTGDDDGPATIPVFQTVGDRVTSWYDVRGAPAPSVNFLAGHHAPSSHLAPRLAKFSSPFINGDRPFALHESAGGTGQRFYLRPVDLQFFDNTLGLTIFIFCRMPPASPNGILFRRRGVLVWTTTGVDAYENFNSGTGLQSFSYTDVGLAVEPFLLSLRWGPGGKVEVRKNGFLVGESSGTITDIPTASSLADELAGAETTRLVDLDIVGTDKAWTSSVLVYGKKLEGVSGDDSFNRAGREILRLYGSKTLWNPVAT